VLIEWLRHGKPTSLGLASGIVAGLVAVTPAAGHIAPWHALILGAASSVVCYLAVRMKNRVGYDDTLDAFGVHGVGGLLGALLTGVFCVYNCAEPGLIGGNLSQFWKQCIGAASGIAFSLVGTVILALALKSTLGLRAADEQERDGLDITVHGERGYHFDIAS
jgi:Amt family ammonium transporter